MFSAFWFATRPRTLGAAPHRAVVGLATLLWIAGCAAPVAMPVTHPSLRAADVDAAAGFETPPVLRASELWPAEVLQGPRHRVREEVPTDGFARHYRIESDFGAFEAHGDDMLRTRLAEIEALATLESMSRSQDFAAAVGEGLKSPFVATWNLIRRPVDSITGIPVAAWEQIQRTAALARSERGEFESRAFREFIGFESRKRELAHRLGVDPYSSNPVLQRELNRFAWAAFAGGLAFRLVPFREVGEGEPGAAHGGEARLRDHSPEDLRRLNRIELAVMGVEEELADAFLAQPWFSPRRQTLLVGALAALDRAADRERFVEASLRARAEFDALFFQRGAELLAAWDRGEGRARRLVAVRRTVGALDAEGRLVVPILVDHVVWTGPTEDFCRDLAERVAGEVGAGDVELLLSGSVSPAARERMEALGLAVTERAFEQLAAAAPDPEEAPR